MSVLLNLFTTDFKRRSKDGFAIGYNIIFPIVMIVILGYLSSESYDKEFTGYQYYSIVMLPFCIAMAMITAAYAGKDDAYKRTAMRFLFSPVSRRQIVLSKLMSCVSVISLCNLVVLIFAGFVWKLPLNLTIIPVFILLAMETYAVCAIGLFIGFGMKHFLFIKNIMNIPISVFAILAGVFYPMGSLNRRMELLFQLSPLTWVNRSIFLLLYDYKAELLWRTSVVLMAVGIIFTILAIRLFKREEYIHGDLPGYDK